MHTRGVIGAREYVQAGELERWIAPPPGRCRSLTSPKTTLMAAAPAHVEPPAAAPAEPVSRFLIALRNGRYPTLQTLDA